MLWQERRRFFEILSKQPLEGWVVDEKLESNTQTFRSWMFLDVCLGAMWQRRRRLLFMQTCGGENLPQTREKMGRWLICKQIRKAFCRVCHCLGNSSRLWTGWHERSWANRKALNLHRSRIITSRKGWDLWVVRVRKSAAFVGSRTILWEAFYACR